MDRRRRLTRRDGRRGAGDARRWEIAARWGLALLVILAALVVYECRPWEDAYDAYGFGEATEGTAWVGNDEWKWRYYTNSGHCGNGTKMSCVHIYARNSQEAETTGRGTHWHESWASASYGAPGVDEDGITFDDGDDHLGIAFRPQDGGAATVIRVYWSDLAAHASTRDYWLGAHDDDLGSPEAWADFGQGLFLMFLAAVCALAALVVLLVRGAVWYAHADGPSRRRGLLRLACVAEGIGIIALVLVLLQAAGTSTVLDAFRLDESVQWCRSASSDGRYTVEAVASKGAAVGNVKDADGLAAIRVPMEFRVSRTASPGEAADVRTVVATVPVGSDCAVSWSGDHVSVNVTEPQSTTFGDRVSFRMYWQDNF